MTFCEDCKWMQQHWWEDRTTCRKKQKAVEATDPACEEYEAPEDQMKMEV